MIIFRGLLRDPKWSIKKDIEDLTVMELAIVYRIRTTEKGV